MIMESHRRYAREARADIDPVELFAFAIDCENQARRDRARYGAHKRYQAIHRSYRALINELSIKIDPENDMGLRAGGRVS